MKKRLIIFILIAVLLFGATWRMERDVVFKGDFLYQLDTSGDSIFISDNNGIRLWRGNNVGDAIDGHPIILYRTATEGQDSIMLYIDADGKARIVASGDTLFLDDIIRTDRAVIDSIIGYLKGKADSAEYADSTDWSDLLDGYNEDYFRDTNDVWRDSSWAYAEATDSLATSKLKADFIVPNNSAYVDFATGRGATFVVAASNSHLQSKVQADWICDGTDDNVEIQEAIDSAATNNGSVKLMEGLYILDLDDDNFALTLADSIEIIIVNGVVLKLEDSVIATGEIGGFFMFPDFSTNIRITGGGTIDGNMSNNDCLRMPIIDIDTGVTHITVSDIQMFDVASPLRAYSESASHPNEYITIKNCYIENAVKEGILWYRTDYVLCEHNTIKNVLMQDGIEPALSNFFVINNNMLDSIAQSGIDITNQATFGIVSNNIITNSVFDAGEAGIAVSGGASDITISNNNIYKTGGSAPGIITGEATKLVVANNLVKDADEWGICITGDYQNIVGNKIYDCDIDGIYLNASYCVISGNVIINNGRYGIREISGEKNNLIANNVCKNNSTGSGIYSEGIASIINNNICENNGNDYDAGIYITGDNMLLSGNLCANNIGYGIYLSTSDSAIVSNNLVYDDSSHQAVGVYVNNSSFCKLNNNRIYKNTTYQIQYSTGKGLRTIIDNRALDTLAPSNVSAIWYGHKYEGLFVTDTIGTDSTYFYTNGKWILIGTE